MLHHSKSPFCSPMLWLFILPVFAACICRPVQARPIAFLGGWSLMNENRIHQNQLMGGYTIGREWSLGVHFSSFKKDEGQDIFFAPVVSYLVLRENEDRQQTNVYVTAGAGGMTSSSSNSETFPAGILTIDVDTETRTFYSALRYEVTRDEDERQYAYARARLGFTPYSAAVGGFHTWVLIQADYDKWQRHSEITPMLRFFFQNMLWETGVSLRGSFQFNWATEV